MEFVSIFFLLWQQFVLFFNRLQLIKVTYWGSPSFHILLASAQEEVDIFLCLVVVPIPILW